VKLRRYHNMLLPATFFFIGFFSPKSAGWTGGLGRFDLLLFPKERSPVIPAKEKAPATFASRGGRGWRSLLGPKGHGSLEPNYNENSHVDCDGDVVSRAVHGNEADEIFSLHSTLDLRVDFVDPFPGLRPGIYRDLDVHDFQPVPGCELRGHEWVVEPAHDERGALGLEDSQAHGAAQDGPVVGRASG